jgi:hypothetical protein
MRQSLKILLIVWSMAAAMLLTSCSPEDTASRTKWLQTKWGKRSTPVTEPVFVAPDSVIETVPVPSDPPSQPAPMELAPPADTRTIENHPSQLPGISDRSGAWDDDAMLFLSEFAEDDDAIDLTDLLLEEEDDQAEPESSDDTPPPPPPQPVDDDSQRPFIRDLDDEVGEISVTRETTELRSVTGQRELLAASMVQINDRFITIEDVLRRLHGTIVSADRPATEMEFRRQMVPVIGNELRRQLTETLVLIEAERTLSDKQNELIDAEVQRTVREMIAAAGGSRSALELQCRQRHTTLDDLLADHRRQLLTQSFVRMRIEPRMIVTRQMLLDYYRSHQDEFVDKRKVQMQIIAAPFKAFLPELERKATEAEWRLARDRARRHLEQAAAAVERGEDFGNVARQYSRGIKRDEGGVWPPLTEGSFRESAVQKNAMMLRPGEICGIIQTRRGFYIVKTLSVTGGRRVSFEEAQETIGETIRRAQYEKLSNEYFQELLEEATISESEKFMEYAVDRAVERYWRGS